MLISFSTFFSKIRRTTGVFSTICYCFLGLAGYALPQVTAAQSTSSSKPSFGAYKPNFAIASFSDNDDTPLQVRFSAWYKFLDCSGTTNNIASELSCRYIRGPGRLSMYFSYTTDFDFYVSSDGDGKLRRQSRPVRNRMTSPALHFDWAREQRNAVRNFWWSNFTTSLVHHSNGQFERS